MTIPLLVLALLVMTSPGVKIRLRDGLMAMPPATLEFTVSVASHPDNRVLDVAAWCDEMDLAHDTVSLAGEADEIQHRIVWTLSEPCEYLITADVFGMNDRHLHTAVRFTVIDPHRSP